MDCYSLDLTNETSQEGLKVWVQADAITGYFSNFDVYVGRLSDRESTKVGLGAREGCASALQATICREATTRCIQGALAAKHLCVWNNFP